MIAGAGSVSDPFRPQRRFHVTPLVEISVLGAAAAIAVASYLVLTTQARPGEILSPALVALLLVANIVPGVALTILLGRRIAHRRAARSAIGGEGLLHVRLVALFSIMAAVPMLLVTVVASLLFQYGIQFWYSDRARGMLENATGLVRTSNNLAIERWRDVSTTAADDIASLLRAQPHAIDDPRFARFFLQQITYRSLSDGVVFTVSPRGEVITQATINPDLINVATEAARASLSSIIEGAAQVTLRPDRIQAITRVPGQPNLYLFTATTVNMKPFAAQLRRAQAVQSSYRGLLRRARSLQLKFNAALLALSLLIVGIAVSIALAVADRLVAPVAELVDAARRVEGGDLTARVTAPRTRDEVGTLANAFNQMTGRLQQQNSALVSANEQLDSRRALIEAVMGGVSAGVISVSPDRTVRIINRSAMALLDIGASPVGRPLAQVAPELDLLIDGAAREAVVEVQAGAEQRTLAVRVARAEAGPILTFDDVTQQLRNQRLAAWSDVARRIAHEIKNPLTPIQLAAERLQRRYGKNVEAGDTTFARLTETIIRQVGDLRRMVDEFSSFARMPKPAFREEPLVDIARQSLFLHEVAHPAVRFDLVHADPGPVLVCDRRQIGQALTNIVKNAVEAIEATGEGGAVMMTLAEAPGRVCVEVADTGIGLPPDRDRIVEPYMTTRARGTGLGLAIVKKIVEEHAGTVDFADREGGGTVVRMTFDTAQLSAFDAAVDHSLDLSGDGQLATLSRIRT